MQASSSVSLGRVVLAQEQDYKPLIAGVVCVSILLLLMLALFAWIKKKKHIDGAYWRNRLRFSSQLAVFEIRFGSG